MGEIRILRVIARLNLGGPARCVIHLAAGLERQGFETLVAAGIPARGEGDMSGELRAAGGRLALLPCLVRQIHPIKDLLALRAVRRLVREFRPHIVHTHTAKAGFIGRTAASALRPAPCLVHTFHGHVLDSYFGPMKSALFRNLERRLAAKTDALVAVSASVRDELIERHRVGSAEKYSLIPSGMPCPSAKGEEDSLRSELGLGDAPVAGVVGRMAPVKGYDLLLDAIPLMLERVPGLRILLVGDGPERGRIEARLAKASWRDAVVLLGFRLDVARVYKTLDLLVLPSRKEGLPTVLLEAAACGCAVAASRIPGVTELFTHEKNALLFDRNSARELAGAAARLALDPGLRRCLAERAAAEIPARVPGYAEVARKHAELYRLLLQKRQP